MFTTYLTQIAAAVALVVGLTLGYTFGHWPVSGLEAQLNAIHQESKVVTAVAGAASANLHEEQVSNAAALKSQVDNFNENRDEIARLWSKTDAQRTALLHDYDTKIAAKKAVLAGLVAQGASTTDVATATTQVQSLETRRDSVACLAAEIPPDILDLMNGKVKP